MSHCNRTEQHILEPYDRIIDTGTCTGTGTGSGTETDT